MEKTKKTGILVVSFGTSFEETRQVTIDAIEKEIADSFSDCEIYRAWTSKMIMAKLKRERGICIPDVKTALTEMAAGGITDVIVQSTHVMNGVEYDQMKEEVLSLADMFASVSFGTPLLTNEEDSAALVQVIAEEFSEVNPEDALVLMGHGTTHYANSIYAALDYRFKDMGYPNIFVGTVEAYPGIDSLLRQVKKLAPEKVYLAPLMIVAGDHATNDMAGEEPDSWASQFRTEGYDVKPVLKGLGEYPCVRELFVKHTQEAMQEAGI